MKQLFHRFHGSGRLAALGVLAVAGGCADYPTIHGPRGAWNGLAPTLIVRNESEATVRVFPWIGRIDTFAESGSSDFREKPVMDVPPGETRRMGLGDPHWSTAGQDGIVRVGILRLGDSYPTVDEYTANTRWFEFEQPHPYDLKICGGDTGALEFESVGEGALIELTGSAGE